MANLLSKIIESFFGEIPEKRVVRREAAAFLKLIAPLLVILIVVFSFHKFVLDAINANVTINCLIIGSASFGAVLIVILYFSAQKDFLVIERFGREAGQGVYMPHLLEQPWLKRRYVRHYLGHIAKTGGTLSSELQQSAIENELHELSNEYEHKMELPQFISGFMIAMGLLGTFIGLLETLTGISGMLDGFGAPGGDMSAQFLQLVVGLRKPLGGMGIAFSASMFGLVTSLMLAIMMINLRRYISRVVSCARNVMHDLTELGRGTGAGSGGAAQLTAEDIAAMARGVGASRAAAPSISEGDSSLQDLVYQMHDTSLGMASRMDGLTHKIEAVLHVFESGEKSTQKLNDFLGGVSARMGETGEAMLEELKSIISGQTEQKIFFQRFIDVSNDTARIMNGIIEVQRESQANLVLSLKDMGVSANDTATRVMGGIVVAQRESQANLALSLKDMSANTNNAIINTMSEVVGSQRESQVGLMGSLKDLGEKLVKIEQSNVFLGKNLLDIRESFTQLGTYAGVGEAITTGIGQQTLLLETLVKEDRNLQKRLTSIQQDLRELLKQPANDALKDESSCDTFPIPPSL